MQASDLAKLFSEVGSALMAGLEVVFDAKIELRVDPPVAKEADEAATALAPEGAATICRFMAGESALPLGCYISGEILEIIGLLPLKDGSDPDRIRRIEIVSETTTNALRDTFESLLAAPASFEASGVVMRETGAWSDGADPLAGAACFMSLVSFSAADQKLVSAWLFIDRRALEGDLLRVPSEAVPSDTVDGDLAILATESLRARLQGLLDGAPTTDLDSPAALVTHMASGKPRGAIVEISPDQFWMLEVLHGLRAMPAFQHKPLVVILDQPTPEAVVECGRLGLFAVLPPEFEKPDLLARLQADS